jgi:hypothetical protein
MSIPGLGGKEWAEGAKTKRKKKMLPIHTLKETM